MISKILGLRVGCLHDPERLRAAPDRPALLAVPPRHPPEFRPPAAVPRVPGQVELSPPPHRLGTAASVWPDATAHHAARVIRCNYPTAHAAYTRFRLALQALTDAEKRPLLGELELDESYFGGKRGRGAGGKVPVFGILGRAGRVYTVTRSRTAPRRR